MIAPVDIEVGTYYLQYKGEANPLIYKLVSIVVEVKSNSEKRSKTGNRGPPTFVSPLLNQVMYASSKFQFSLPTRADMDGDSVYCQAFYGVN